MKKAILLILTLLYAAKLFSYECRVSKDANLYGNYYPFKVSDRIGIIKENSIVYFDSMQLTTYNIDGEENYLNTSYPLLPLRHNRIRKTRVHIFVGLIEHKKCLCHK